MATATENNILQAQPRTVGSKNDARRIRSSGKIPAVVYGAGKQARPVSVDPRQVARILDSETGYNTIFDLALDGEQTKAMIVDWQYEPIKGALLHIDLKRIAMDQKLHVKVPIVLKGEAEGVKQQGGILEQVAREVAVECLPSDIPTAIEVDVSHLVFGKVLRISDLPPYPRVAVLSDANQPVAHVISVKEEAAPTPEAAAEAAVAPAEPEVIKKGKQETAEEGAEAASAEKPEKAEKKEKEKK